MPLIIAQLSEWFKIPWNFLTLKLNRWIVEWPRRFRRKNSLSRRLKLLNMAWCMIGWGGLRQRFGYSTQPLRNGCELREWFNQPRLLLEVVRDCSERIGQASLVGYKNILILEFARNDRREGENNLDKVWRFQETNNWRGLAASLIAINSRPRVKASWAGLKDLVIYGVPE